MKADLIENLIVAHCSGDESKFKDAIEILAGDEEKKGNVPLAQRIRNAYKLKKVSEKRSTETPLDTMSFSPQTTQGSAPRDKDSLLELYEIVESNVRLSDVILSDSQKQIIEQVISEQKNSDELLKHKIAPSNRLLLCGPPGCGKTMTAYAIGNELSM
jgi:SpoVK/Ycf46/Vps4 family AAA+-type ATPase